MLVIRSTSLAVICLMCLSTQVFAQGNTAGGFGNFGLSSNNLLSNSQLGTPGATGAAGAGAAGAAGTGTGITSNALGGFDASFGASGALGAAALGRAGGLGGIGGLGGFGGGFGGIGGGFGGGGFGGGRGGFNTQGQNSQTQTTIRATVKIGFSYPGPSAQVRSQAINRRLERVPLPGSANNVQVQMNGRTAVLVGSVESTDDGLLIERLLSLEPGIDGVDNQLTVGPATTNESTPPLQPSVTNTPPAVEVVPPPPSISQ